MNTENKQHTNRLIDERSPYLLQHAHNPVDWYPWGDEAFGKAKEENKLIFLSIGYSTCHWCHVMEKESFEDQMVADLMNRVFVSIKVDREERPDLDNVFMEIAMMMNRRGGWPLNLILTPQGRPFYSATYIPRGGSAGRTGMLELIPQLEAVWNEKPEEVRASADEILRALKDSSREDGINTFVDSSAPALDQIKTAAFGALKNSYDSDSGGFNRQPKFPQPQNLLFLLRYYLSAGSAEALDMAVTTLDHMAAGGIYDRLGYGFHRYSTDKEWRLPHFEKMLYDQAMIILAYTEAWQITGKSSFRRTAEEVITYVLRDMRSPEGGFYSAEDADSEGVEGKFYLWDYDELVAILEEAGYDSSRWAEYFSLHPRGNFADEATKLKTGENILFTDPDADSKLPGEYEEVRSLLFSEREKRVHPHKDDKILTDWNGLMIFALAKAAGAFGEPKYYEAAVSAANFITPEMLRAGGALLHSYRLGESGTLGMIDDYAFLTRGLLELYRAGFDQSFIEQAVLITGYARAHFEDGDHGGYFQSDSLQTDLLLRKKALIDNAVPAGNSLMYENLMQLFKITGETAYRDSADGILATLGDELRSYPSAFAMLLSSFDYSGTAGREIVIAAESAEAAADMLKVINSRFLPGTVVVLKTPETDKALAGLAPYTAYYSLPEGRKAAVYLCTDFTCSSPVYTAEGLRALLEE